jgi:outer membrane immunogenic protein
MLARLAPLRGISKVKLLTTVALTGLMMLGAAGAVSAADLVVPAAAATPESDAYDWTGAYIGANFQYSFGHTTASYVDQTIPLLTGVDLSMDPNGFGGGATLGFNQQLSGGIVIGIEGDVDYNNITATIDDEAAVRNARPGNTITGTTDWTGTVRGRVGVAVGSILPYLTAGLAVANTHVSATDGNLSDSAVLTGWTAGGGIEVALADNWSAKGEVLYTDLGTHTYFADQPYASTSHPTSTTVRFGINYKF